MIRIEVSIEERNPGKVDILCRSFEGCWCESTKTERKIAGEISRAMRGDLECVSRVFGDVETCEGEAVKRLQREGQV